MFVNDLSLFAPCCKSVLVDDRCLSNVGNDGSRCSVGENSVLCRRGDTSVPVSCDGCPLELQLSNDNSLTLSGC